MATEIERKFRVKNDGWRAAANAGTLFRQGYFDCGAKASVRVRIEGDTANLNIKSANTGVRRQEFEYAVPLPEAQEMLDTLCEKPLVEKRRYRVAHGGHLWEIDVFEGDNTGLIIAEVELEAEDTALELPGWVGEEVSDDPRYYNASLVKHPYRDWNPRE